MNKSDSTHLHNAFVGAGRGLLASMAKSAVIKMVWLPEEELLVLPLRHNQSATFGNETHLYGRCQIEELLKRFNK